MPTSNSNATPTEKSGLHLRNPHRFGYDFKKLALSSPELAAFVAINKFNIETIDFANPDAVKALNSALLKHHYGLTFWDMPKGYLVPPIPGRADYIHTAADLLASVNRGVIPTGPTMKVLDVGVGASCVYPIIGHKEYGWSFVGADTDVKALKSAKNIIDSNKLNEVIVLRTQTSPNSVLKGIVNDDEEFDLVICNPPFHSSLEEVNEAAERKWKNLKVKTEAKPVLNFAGQNAELIYPGGEEAFVNRMILQSAQLFRNAYWYTSLISKESALKSVRKALKNVKALDVRILNMSQGQKQSRIVAWTFLNETEQRNWRERHWWNS